MSGEFSSARALEAGDRINGYEILKAFDPGGFTYPAKARAPNGRVVFFKKYRKPGGSSPWQKSFISYQEELKKRVQGTPAKAFCYEFIDFFKLEKAGARVPMRVFYQVFEWIDGGSDLRSMLDTARPLLGEQRLIFSKVMLAGVNSIHKAGIIHTDLKPENLYLVPDDSIAAKFKLRLIDMDFSVLDGLRPPWLGHEGFVGTPGYMSPEHLRAEGAPVRASDVFTCALMLGELLGEGHPARADMDGYAKAAVDGTLPPIRLREDIPEISDKDFLSHVIGCALRPDASRRPTAEQLLLALNGRLAEWEGRMPQHSEPSPFPPRTSEPAPPRSAEAAASGESRTPHSPRAAEAAKSVTPETSQNAAVELVGPSGTKLQIRISTIFGRSNFRSWGGDFELFMSPEQFRLFRNASGAWMVEHCSSAKNATNLDGSELSEPTQVRDGATLTLGRTGKCPIRLSLK